MVKEINPNAYFAEASALFNSERISADSIKQFIVFENRYKLHLNPGYRDNYAGIFLAIRTKIVIPNHNKPAFIEMFESLAVIYRNSGVALPQSPKSMDIVRDIMASLNQNDFVNRLFLLRISLVLSILSNLDFSAAFFDKIFEIPSAASFRSLEEITAFSRYLRAVFPDSEKTFRLLSEKVFCPGFENRPLIMKKAAFMWITEIFWLNVYKENPSHLILWQDWLRIFYDGIKRDDDELVFFMHFPLSHIFLNCCHEQHQFRQFTDEVELPFSEFIQRSMKRWGIEPVKRPLPENPKKIAFMYDRLAGNSPTKLLVSLVHYLKDAGYKLFVYDMAFIEKSISEKEFIDAVKNAGAKYVNNHDLIEDADTGHYYSHFNKNMALRKAILEDEPDILVFTGNKTQSAFITSSRTAPMQVFWDHGNHEYNVLELDKRICHFDDGYKSAFNVQRFNLSMLPEYLNPETEKHKAEAAAIKEMLPPHKVVLGSIGRIMKLSDEYMETVAEILKQNPDSIYLACGTGPIEEKKKKAAELGVSDRFIFTGWVNPHVYGHVIDIYLNTFPLAGGESVNEFLSKGKDKYLVQ